MAISVNGLTEAEVLSSRELHGTNTLVKRKRRSFFRTFLGNFGDPMLRILLIALGIQLVFVFQSGAWLEIFGIAMAILIAVIVATVSEHGSEAAFEKLQQQASAIFARVRRNNTTISIPVGDIVVGDVVLLGSGEKVPADGHIIHGEIEVDQSLLNGESKEAKKTVSDGNEKTDYLDSRSVFSGTVVTSGEAMMLVTSVGGKTEYGKIAAELQEDNPTSPLKVKLTGLAKMISVIGYIGAALVAVAYFFNLFYLQGQYYRIDDWAWMLEHLLRASTLVVAVIVMAVPEGLPMMITVVLSSNMKHMLRDNVLVRKLNGIETAGSMNILFTDKTGTLTNGKLEVVGVVGSDGKFVEKPNGKMASLLGTALRYNTQADISPDGKAIGGNSTDRILLEYAKTLNYEKDLVVSSQVPFNSKDKFMSTTLSDGRTLLKGAAEVLLPKLKNFNKTKIEKQIMELSSKAYRLLVVAVDDTLVGLLAIRDQVRPESAPAIRRLQSAKIQTVMITGDAKETAMAIAREVDILQNDDEIILTSDELAKLTDQEVADLLPRLRVIARALPSDKSRLVRVAQSLNLVVGMTGDGVNDAPALKKSDIGFAMGSGTEVAKEAGDIVILDDNIQSISRAVSYGRTIFKSIRKFLIFKLTINFCAMAVSIIAPLLNVDTPITVIQMLWINLVMDTLAGLAFGGEKPQEKYMTEAPKRRDESIINRYMWIQIITASIFTAAISLWFLTSTFMTDLSYGRGETYARSAFFAFFMMLNIFNAFNARSHDLNIFSHMRKNMPFIWIMGVVTIVQITMIYVGGDIFRTTPLDFMHLAIIMLLAISVIPFDMIRKVIVNNKSEVKT